MTESECACISLCACTQVLGWIIVQSWPQCSMDLKRQGASKPACLGGWFNPRAIINTLTQQRHQHTIPNAHVRMKTRNRLHTRRACSSRGDLRWYAGSYLKRTHAIHSHKRQWVSCVSWSASVSGRAHSLGQEHTLARLRALLSAQAHPGFIPAVFRGRGSQKNEPDAGEEPPSRPHTALDSHRVRPTPTR